MERYKNIIILFIFLNSSICVYSDHVFTYIEDISPKSIQADGISTWTFTVTLTVPKILALITPYMEYVSTAVQDFEGGTLCGDIELYVCSMVSGNRMGCYCENKVIGDQIVTHTIKAKLFAEVRFSEKAIILKHEPKVMDGSNNIITDDTKKYPKVFEVIDVTIRENGITIQQLFDDTNNLVSLYGSDIMASVVEICATNVFNGVFKLDSNEVEFNDDGCRKIANTPRDLSFSYTELGGLQRTANFTGKIGHVCDYADPCYYDEQCKKMSSPPGYICNCTIDFFGNVTEDKTLWRVGQQCNETHVCADSDSRTKCEEHGTCVYPHASENGKRQCACEPGYTEATCQENEDENEGTRPSGKIWLAMVMSLSFLFAPGVQSFAWL